MSCNISLRRSPKPGALTQTTFRVPRRRVHDQGVQSLALNVLSHDDDQLLAGLDQLLQDGQDVGDHRDLLIGDEDIGVINDSLHLLSIGDHIGVI